MYYALSRLLHVYPAHPALPLMTRWVYRTLFAGACIVALLLLMLYFQKCSGAIALGILAAFAIHGYQDWQISDFRNSIRDDDGRAWIQPSGN